MKINMIIGVVLIVLGALAIGHRSINYTTEETVLQVGPLEASVEQERSVTVPLWAGIGLLVLGAVVLVVGRR